MPFTSEEIRGAVDAFLNSPVEVPSLSTGARDILLARDRAFDLLTNALVGDPKAVYHLAWMASNRLYGMMSEQATMLENIRRSCIELQRTTFNPFDTIDELTTAQTALLEIDAAAGSSTSGATGPGIGRFQRVTRQFVSRELQPMLAPVTDNGVTTIPDTPINLRREVQRTWSLVKTTDAEIKTLSGRLLALMSEFGNLRLPERSIQTLIGKLSDRTGEIIDDLSSAKAEEASRGAYLDLMVMDSILGRTSAFAPPVLVQAEGTNAYLASPTSGSVATSSVSGPYVLSGGQHLELVIGGVSELAPIPDPDPIKSKVRAQDIADSINENTSATARVTLYSYTTPAYIIEAVGSEDKLYPALHGASVGISDSVLGTIKVADWIKDEDFLAATTVYIGSGALAGPYPITARDLATKTFTVSPGPIAISTGLNYIVMGPAGSEIGFGDRVDIRDPSNPMAGATYYEVANIGEEVTLNTNIFKSPNYHGDSPPTRLFFSEAQVEFFTEYLELEAPPGSTFSIPTSAVSTALGLDVGGLLNPITAGKSTSVRIPVDLSLEGASAGDFIELDEVLYEVQGVTFTSSGTVVQMPTSFDYVTTPHEYRYLSGQHLALETMLDAVATYPEDIVTPLDVLVAQIVYGQSAGRIANEITSMSATIDAILVALRAYHSPGRSRGLDAAITMMREQGMDRATDLLLSLQLTELFSMNRDGASYNTNLARAAATATRAVSPVSKSQPDTEEIIGVFKSGSGISRYRG